MKGSREWPRGDAWALEESVALAPLILHQVERGIARGRPEEGLQSAGPWQGSLLPGLQGVHFFSVSSQP